MSFDSLLEEAGDYKTLFRNAREKGVDVAEQMQTAMSIDSQLFRTVGCRVVKMEEGLTELTFPFSDAVSRRGGMVHGGVVMYTLDNACGLAVMTVNPGIDQLTIEIKVNFLEPLKNGPFTATGRIIRAGGSTAVAEGEIRDADGRLCAKSLGTWYMIRKR